MSAIQALTPRLRLRPGQRPAIDGGRPMLAARIVDGCSPDEAPDRLARVFNLCGEAHRLAARLALAAANDSDIDAAAIPALRETLRQDTVREHARRIAFDWAGLLARSAHERIDGIAGWRELAAWHQGSDPDGLARWLHRCCFGEPADVWLRRIDAAPRPLVGAAQWLRQAPATPLTHLLADLQAQLPEPPIDWNPLRPSAAGLGELAAAVARDAEFCRYPHLADGRVPDTGPWSRINDARDGWRGGAFARLLARVAETARLALPEGAQWLCFGALPLDRYEGLGWCEMARGLLLHWVRLRTDVSGGRILDYRIAAPTEWNFHPDGALANALTGMTTLADALRVRTLAAAFDPCAALDVV